MMAGPTTQLDNLPVEVVRRIAAGGTCVDVLNLMKVNHKLFNICKDWNVFQGSICGNGSGLTKRLDWDLSFLTPQMQPDTWARYALADQRVGEFLSQTEHPIKSSQTHVALYAPQLVVAHHPLLNLRAVNRVCELYFSEGRPESHSLALAFTIAACVISHFEPEDLTDAARIECYKALTSYDKHSDDHQRSLSFCLWYLWPIPSSRAPYEVPGLLNERYVSSDQTLLKAYVALSFLYYELKMALVSNNFFHPEGADEEDLPAELPLPPTTDDIPFSSFMPRVPLPFAPDGCEAMTTTHIPLMATAAFLSSGSWTGYIYTNTPRDSPTPRFQYPMFSVRFQTQMDANARYKVRFTTTGMMFTANGAFGWSGNLDTRTGNMDMDARYHNEVGAVPRCWQAVMTPFGIVGSLGGSRHGHWMWMWKEEWCARNAKEDEV